MMSGLLKIPFGINSPLFPISIGTIEISTDTSFGYPGSTVMGRTYGDNVGTILMSKYDKDGILWK
ncbi:MAG: hypothetical protein OCC49_09710 [Fibrobacterales bacterium]